MDFWPTFVPDSLPVRPQPGPRSSLLPNSLHSMGWKPDPTFVICQDLTRETYYSPLHSSPGSTQTEDDIPSSLGPPPYSPDTPTMSGVDSVEDLVTNTNSRGTATQSAFVPTQQVLPMPTATHTATNLTLLTLNTQKAGTNSPSMVDIIHMIDDHSPDILFLTETPLPTRNRALKHVLTNRGYCVHFNPANAPSPSDGLPEARIPTSLTHAGGGAWIA